MNWPLSFFKKLWGKTVIKNIIFKAGVVLNDDLLYFKYYEILYYYLRREPEWNDFNRIIQLREYFTSKYRIQDPYLEMARRYLSARDFARFKQEIDLFTKKAGLSYIKIIPGIKSILQPLNYYYQIILFNSKTIDFNRISRKFQLNFYFGKIIDERVNNQKFSSSNSVLIALKKLKAQANETIYISDLPDSEMLDAQKLNMFTIQTAFSPVTKGVLPQSMYERVYFNSVEKIPRFAPNISSAIIPDEVAKHPADILKMIADFDKISGKPPAAPEEKEEIETLWDVAKTILFPTLPDNNEK